MSQMSDKRWFKTLVFNKDEFAKWKESWKKRPILMALSSLFYVVCWIISLGYIFRPYRTIRRK